MGRTDRKLEARIDFSACLRSAISSTGYKVIGYEITIGCSERVYRNLFRKLNPSLSEKTLHQILNCKEFTVKNKKELFEIGIKTLKFDSVEKFLKQYSNL